MDRTHKSTARREAGRTAVNAGLPSWLVVDGYVDPRRALERSVRAKRYARRGSDADRAALTAQMAHAAEQAVVAQSRHNAARRKLAKLRRRGAAHDEWQGIDFVHQVSRHDADFWCAVLEALNWEMRLVVRDSANPMPPSVHEARGTARRPMRRAVRRQRRRTRATARGDDPDPEPNAAPSGPGGAP